jgi:hypothetical protein
VAKLTKKERRERRQATKIAASMEKRVLDANRREAISALGLSFRAMLTSRTSSARSVFVVEEVPLLEEDEATPK